MSLAFFALLLSAPPALADIPPPAGYEESCTVEKQQVAGQRCEYCSGAYHGDSTFCDRKFSGQVLSRRCRTRGASVWGEVWCGDASAAASIAPVAVDVLTPAEPTPAEPTPAEPTPAEPAAAEPAAPEAAAPTTEKRACAVAGGAGGGGLGLAAVLLALGLRRRR